MTLPTFVDQRPTFRDHWHKIEKNWNHRSKQIADFIPDHSSVLDIGAGAMSLRDYLKPNCRYQPSDIHDRGQGCIVADLNRNEFPSGVYDFVTMIGVLVYLNDPAWVLENCRAAAPRGIFTYNPLSARAPDRERQAATRHKSGWRHTFTTAEFSTKIEGANWTIQSILPVRDDDTQRIFVCY